MRLYVDWLIVSHTLTAHMEDKGPLSSVTFILVEQQNEDFDNGCKMERMKDVGKNEADRANVFENMSCSQLHNRMRTRIHMKSILLLFCLIAKFIYLCVSHNISL